MLLFLKLGNVDSDGKAAGFVFSLRLDRCRVRAWTVVVVGCILRLCKYNFIFLLAARII